MIDMVSITEAARILNVSPDTIRRRIRNGELDARKVKTARGYRWQVELTQDAHVEPMHNDYVNALREQIQSLEAELAARRTEIQQLHALLHQKALPAPSWWQRLFGKR